MELGTFCDGCHLRSHCINNKPHKVDDLLAEVEQLRLELWHEWWDNHAEYCGTRWPHADGVTCNRPPPEILAGHTPPEILARVDA
jgi:hypothetical protein